MISTDYIIEPEKRIPTIGNYDVIVIGGGLTGIIAALTTQRLGSKTLLLESKAFLGGVGTMGLPLQGFYDLNGNQIIRGIPDEFLVRLKEKKGASKEFIKCEMHNPFLILEPEIVKLVCQEMLQEAGIDILLHTLAADVYMIEKEINGIFIENKSGRQYIKGKVFLDCSGDGDIAARCKNPFSFGRENDNLSQASTLMFRLDNVNISELIERVLNEPETYDLIPTLPRSQFLYTKKHILVGLNNLIKKAAAEGLIGLPWDRVCYITSLDERAVNINMVHVDGKDATDGLELTELEMEGRAQISIIIEFLKKYVPGFQDALFTHSAAWSGIRETRHILGEKTLTEEDVNNCNMPSDAVVVGGYPIDIHFSRNESDDSLHFNKIKPYGISFGCFLPVSVDNLLVAGRSISATHTAMASARVMGTCMGMGQAVGCAAALAISKKCSVKEIDVEEIRNQICSVGGFLY